VVDFDVVFPHVLHVHLRDTSRSELQVPAGLGEVDYNRLITLLRQHNYRRTMSVDLFPKTLSGEDRLRELRQAAAAADKYALRVLQSRFALRNALQHWLSYLAIDIHCSPFRIEAAPDR
jgi:L-ribulose-5-phosphate 3-epimerase UlaE